MAEGDALTAALAAVNAASPFNGWAGMEIVAAAPGAVTLALPSRPELLNHAGALHAGVQTALLDTVSGYAAGTIAGNVVTLQIGVQFLASAKGDRFEARASITRAGRSQLFADAKLLALRGDEEVLVATATAVLTRL
jgi:uncharacterized protein (TIGR00369 family)